MKREQIQQWINEAYHVLVDLEPKKVDSILVHEDILK